MPEYVHTLISDPLGPTPTPQHVQQFVEVLRDLGALPLKSTISLLTKTGKFVQGRNPFTGQVIDNPSIESSQPFDISAIAKHLKGKDDFDLQISGEGPPPLPPLRFSEVQDLYDYVIRCCSRPSVVSTSDWHDDSEVTENMVLFGQPCDSRHYTGTFYHPSTLAAIRVPNAGCARFWIEFEFGNDLFPEIAKSLELLPDEIVNAAQAVFRSTFVQGCRWCA